MEKWTWLLLPIVGALILALTEKMRAKFLAKGDAYTKQETEERERLLFARFEGLSEKIIVQVRGDTQTIVQTSGVHVLARLEELGTGVNRAVDKADKANERSTKAEHATDLNSVRLDNLEEQLKIRLGFLEEGMRRIEKALERRGGNNQERKESA